MLSKTLNTFAALKSLQQFVFATRTVSLFNSSKYHLNTFDKDETPKYDDEIS